MQNLLNVNQVAFILKVHPLTVRRYIKEKKLNAVKAGGNIRIPETELSLFTKAFEPRQKDKNVSERKRIPAKTFNHDDPLLRLEGRGAGLRLTNLT